MTPGQYQDENDWWGYVPPNCRATAADSTITDECDQPTERGDNDDEQQQ